jgi:ribosome recycling factor
MVEEVFTEVTERMQKAVEFLKRELASIRTGRASPAILDGVKAEYYGAQLPIRQLATISAPEPRLIVIQPWDSASQDAICKAIQRSDIGLVPVKDGNLIKVSIPPLTEERRKELERFAKKKAEESKVAIRNIRRDANNRIKELKDEGSVSEDEARRAQEKVQKITDDFIEKVNQVLAAKEKEITQF